MAQYSDFQHRQMATRTPIGRNFSGGRNLGKGMADTDVGLETAQVICCGHDAYCSPGIDISRRLPMAGEYERSNKTLLR